MRPQEGTPEKQEHILCLETELTSLSCTKQIGNGTRTLDFPCPVTEGAGDRPAYTGTHANEEAHTHSAPTKPRGCPSRGSSSSSTLPVHQAWETHFLN